MLERRWEDMVWSGCICGRRERLCGVWCEMECREIRGGVDCSYSVNEDCRMLHWRRASVQAVVGAGRGNGEQWGTREWRPKHTHATCICCVGDPLRKRYFVLCRGSVTVAALPQVARVWQIIVSRSDYRERDVVIGYRRRTGRCRDHKQCTGWHSRTRFIKVTDHCRLLDCYSAIFGRIYTLPAQNMVDFGVGEISNYIESRAMMAAK